MPQDHVCGTLQGWHTNSHGVFSYRAVLLFDGERYRARCVDLVGVHSVESVAVPCEDEVGEDVGCLNALVKRIKRSIDRQVEAGAGR